MKNPSRDKLKPQHASTRSQHLVIKVLTEGKVTEPKYLKRLARGNSKVTMKCDGIGKSPENLIYEATKFLDKGFDQIWCVFDVDHHPLQRINEMKAGASRDNIVTVASNPCFELWLVLHREEQTAYVTSSKIRKRAEDLRLIDGKKIAAAGWSCLFDNYEDAKARAKALDEMHRQNGSPSGSNPSSDVWRLVDVLRS